MLKFIVKRLLQGFLVMFGVVVVVFCLVHVLPGDPAKVILGKETNPETVANIRKAFGLDLPLHTQLTHYLNDLSPLSFHEDTPENKRELDYTVLFSVGNNNVFVIKKPYLRRSFASNKRVSEIIVETLIGTFWLAITAMAFATLFGIIFGLIAALNRNKTLDHFLVSSSVLGISAPSFVTALLMSMIFGFYLAEYTGLPMTGYLWKLDPFKGQVLELQNIILPAITLGLRPLSIITQLTRSSMLDVLNQDYIRTAKSKGVGKLKLVLKHALKNALNPVITAVSGWLASLMAGAVFVEYIFSWKGLGYKTIKAVEMLDFPIIMGAAIVVGAIFVLVNIFVDILYAILDPRVRLSKV
ncbi:MAG: ABC transporter permease [Flammeovirgaceae bacterium]